MRLASLTVLSLVAVFSMASSANADGWKGPLSQYLNSNSNSSTAGVNRSQAEQINNNGNNGNHYGWDKNGNGQSSRNTTYTGNTNGTGKSVPGPDTLILLGAGLSGLVLWRKTFAKA
jgi:hypothetical protein